MFFVKTYTFDVLKMPKNEVNLTLIISSKPMLKFRFSSTRDEFYPKYLIFSKGEAIYPFLFMGKITPNLHVSKKGTCNYLNF